MRKALSIAAAILAVAMLAGCSGSSGGGGGTTPVVQVTRYVTGFVYAKGNGGGGSGAAAIVSPSSTPPTGYFAPTAGTVTLDLAEGTLVGRAPAQYTRDMVDGNDVIVAATSPDGGTLDVSASGLELNGTSKTLTSFSVGLGTKAVNDKTTLALNSGDDTTYTPGDPASIKVTVDGAAPLPGQQFVSGQPGGYSLAAAVFDINGVAISGANPVFTAANSPSGGTDRVSITGSVLTPAEVPTTATEGDVNVTTSITGSSLTATFTGAFTFGTPSSISIVPTKTTLLWDVTGTVPPLDTLSLTGTVLNSNGVAIPGAAYAWTGTNIISSNWDTTGTPVAIVTPSGNADANGQFTTVVNAPAKADGVLTGGDKNPKGLQTITATAGTATGTQNITVNRPLGSFSVAGDQTIDIGQVLNYTPTNALDVDNDSVANPTGIAWTVANAGNAGGTVTIGNVGDMSVRSVSVSTINGTTGSLTAGNVPGLATITATAPSGVIATLTVDVFGTPTKVFLNPDTVPSVIPGANGEYAGANGTTKDFTFDLLDAFGHTLPGSSYTGYTSATTITSGAGGSITAGGVGVNSFTLTFGPGDGTFSVSVAATYTGINGTQNVNVPGLVRTAGVNGS